MTHFVNLFLRLMNIFETKPFEYLIEKKTFNYESYLSQESNGRINPEWKSIRIINIRGLLLVISVMLTITLIVFNFEKMIPYTKITRS